MKLATFRFRGAERFGALVEGGIVDISGRYADLFAALAAAPAGEAIPLGEVTLLPPVPRPGKIVCVGLNYRSHLALLPDPEPQYPILFTKPNTSLIATGQPILLPKVSTQVDYEGELAVIIGRRGKYIARAHALDHVAGYACANDISAHDIEFRTSQWTSGKMLDTFCPMGPAVTSADEIDDPNRLRLTTELNGETVQDESTADMLFPVDELIAYVSTLTTLEPGDVLLTGTPAGLGCMREPPVFLKAGDVLRIAIEGVGVLENRVEDEPCAR